MDERVIDIPFWKRWPLVNLIIAPFRAPKSAEEYRKLWTPEGSPLLLYGKKVQTLLQTQLGEEYVVALGMRYQSPSIQSALEILKQAQVRDITVIPLFPQYASATTGSVAQKVMELVKGWQIIPDMHFVEHFHTHPLYIGTFAALGRKYLESHSYDHVMFSYHGVPERQILKAATATCCKLQDTCRCQVEANAYCYRSACFETSRLIAAQLGLKEEQYTVCFQSRLGKEPWIQPYTEDVVKSLPKNGFKKVLVFSPAFIADCLETTVEVGEAYKELFEELGGEHWQLVESLNDHPDWIRCLEVMILAQADKKTAMTEAIQQKNL